MRRLLAQRRHGANLIHRSWRGPWRPVASPRWFALRSSLTANPAFPPPARDAAAFLLAARFFAAARDKIGAAKEEMRSRFFSILTLLALAAFPTAAHTRTLSEPNNTLQSSIEIESENVFPAIIADAPDTLPVFTRSQKLASGFLGLAAQPNIQRTLDLGQESWLGDDYLHARYYNPNLGRFLSVDPGPSAEVGRPQSWNRYSYTSNNPVNRVDPDGRVDTRLTRDIERDIDAHSAGKLSYEDFQKRNVARVDGAMKALSLLGVGKAAGWVYSIVKLAVNREPQTVPQLPAPKERGNANPVPERGTFYVDPKGNVIPTPPGGRIAGSPDGRFVQAQDAAGNPTGVRIDGPHKPASHPDPRAQQPHAHVPGVANPDGTPWLPINLKDLLP